MSDLTPITRNEHLLNGDDLEPKNRKEMFLKRIYDKTQSVPEPETREEYFLKKAGDASGDITIEQLNVTESGTYAEQGKAYSPVVVNVPSYLVKDVPNLPQAVASFDDGEEYPIIKLKFDITAVQSGSGEPSPENVRPISGWDGANVEVVGANLWDEEWVNGYFNTNTGEFIEASSNSSICSKNYLSVKGGNTYLFVQPTSSGPQVYQYNSNKEFISRITSITTTNRTFTVDSNCAFIKFVVFNYGSGHYDSNISINYPSTDTSYHAYNGHTYPISWQTECGTVYGDNFKVFKDGGKWYITVNSCPYFASYNGETLVGEWISDRDVYAVGTTPTIGAQVVNIGGEVTTTTFEISTEIATLLGVNNIFADCGDVEECRYVTGTL